MAENRKLDIDWRPKIDTMLAHYCLDERSASDDSGQKGSHNIGGIHSLKVIARERYNAPAWEENLKTELRSKNSKNYGDSNPEILSKYLANDTLYTYLLAHDLVDDMIKDGVIDVHNNILVPAALVFRDIELLGAKLDTNYLYTLDNQLETEASEILADIMQYATSMGMPLFNPNSPKQLGELLFDKMKCPQIDKRSTDKTVLSQLAVYYPVCKKIVEYRQKKKLRGTYTTGLISRCHDDGRIRSSFLLHGTVTGRLSCQNPNVQNIPSTIGPMIKKAFVATEGWVMVDADYSQLELRIAGWYSNDDTLIRCYNEGVDIHTQVAADIFHKELNEVTKYERFIAKTIDFGIIYGRGPQSLMGILGCPLQEAQGYIDGFLNQYEKLKVWMENNQKSVISEGYVQTPFKRKRRFPFITNNNRSEILRQCINAPIQSMASDLCLQALTRIHNKFNPEYQRILLTVHDSIIIECKIDKLEETIKLMKDEMELCPLPSPLPFKAEFKYGYSWGEMTDMH